MPQLCKRTVRAWAVSPFFPPQTDSGVPVVPAGGPLGELKRIESGDDGLIELHQMVPIPVGTRAVAA